MKDLILKRIVASVPETLKTFDSTSGRFIAPGHPAGLGWSPLHQDLIYTFAVLYRTPSPENPYAGDRNILDVCARAGDALASAQKDGGKFDVVNPTGENWGCYTICWTTYHWLEASVLLAEELGAERLERWRRGISAAYETICADLRKLEHIHNIPAFHAMGLVRAGQVFKRAEWIEVGSGVIKRCAGEQTELGYWIEHDGPTPTYNSYYTHALGLYHRFTGDESVLPAIRRALDFQFVCTYPNGSPLETIDSRCKYKVGVGMYGLAAYTLFPEGRRFVRWLLEKSQRFGIWGSFTPFAWEHAGPNACTPLLASAVQYGVEGPEAPIPLESSNRQASLGTLARVTQRGDWFHAFSAITAKPGESRWGMDLQAFVSLYHELTGLIIGGGNSREQPELSNFRFGTQHIPDGAKLVDNGVELSYGKSVGTITLRLDGLAAEVVMNVQPHGDAIPIAQLMVRTVPGKPIVTASGRTLPIDGSSIELSSEDAGGAIAHNGWRLHLPQGANVRFPVLPFNPYRQDGKAPLDLAALVVSIPLRDRASCACRITIE